MPAFSFSHWFCLWHHVTKRTLWLQSADRQEKEKLRQNQCHRHYDVPPPPGSPWTTPESKRNHRKQFPHMLTASHPKHLPPYSLSQERRASAGACSAPQAPELICFFSSLFLPAWFSPRITLQINCVHPRSCLRLYFLGNPNKEAGRRLVPQWRREVVRASPRKGAMRMQRAGWSHRSFKGRMDGNWQLIRYGCGRAEWDKGGG